MNRTTTSLLVFAILIITPFAIFATRPSNDDQQASRASTTQESESKDEPTASEGKEEANRIDLTTLHQTHPLGRIRRIRIVGTLDGKAKFHGDPNLCRDFNHFGPARCTEAAYQPVPVKLKHFQTHPRTGEICYEVTDAPLEHSLYLIMPGRKKPKGVSRLVYLDPDAPRELLLQPFSD